MISNYMGQMFEGSGSKQSKDEKKQKLLAEYAG